MISRALLLAAVWGFAAVAGADGPPADLALDRGWRVRADPRRAGTAGRWDAAGFDDSEWARVPLARTGVGEPVWCRRWIDMPAGWPRSVLVIEGLAGRADLWVNGVNAGRDLVRRRTSGGAVLVELGRLAGGKPRALLALRLAAGPEGPAAVGAVRLVGDPGPWVSVLADRLGYAALVQPELPWPSWTRGEGSAWTAFADPAGGPAGLGGWRGDLEGSEGLATVSCWLYDKAAARLYSAPAVSCVMRLEGRYLPLPAVTMRAGRAFAVTVSAWPLTLPRPGSSPVRLGVGEALVENTSDRPREADLLVVVHPFGVRGGISPVKKIRYDRATQSFWVNDRAVLVLAGTPDAAGAAAFDPELPLSVTAEGRTGPGLLASAKSQSAASAPWSLAQLAARGELPPAREAADEAGLASAAAVYRLRIQPFGFRTQSFRFFLTDAPSELGVDLAKSIREVDRTAGWREVSARWQMLIAAKNRVFLRVPDKRAQDAFYANLGHLLVAQAAGLVPEGGRPLAAAALLRAGHAGSATGPVAGLGAAEAWASAPAAAAPSAASASALVDGTWRPGDSLNAAWAAARAGDGEAAGRIVLWWLQHPTTPGAQAWAERVDPATGRWAGGALPDPRAAALYLCAVRDMVVSEEGGALWLDSALPPGWTRPGDVVDVRHLPTAFGIWPGHVLASYPNEMVLRRLSAERVANRGRGPAIDPAEVARPPAGLRWRVPGSRRIRSVAINGTPLVRVPADRVVELPPDFREVRVVWRPAPAN